jgi:ribonuclease D
MPTPPDYIWIDTQQNLIDFSRSLDPSLPLTIDIEADSLHHYREKLCLVSVAHGNRFILIDALAIKDWTAIWPFWQRHTWIFHGMDYDLKMLQQVGAGPPAQIFDTMLAAQLLNFPAVGYAALVEHYFLVKLNKSSQREDWSKRPLPKKMIAYAVLDVSYLQPLAEKIKKDLKENEKLEWHRQTCERVMFQSFKASSSRDEEEASSERWRISGCRDLPADALPILKALWYWREKEAERRDVPVFKVIHNNQLLALARWGLNTQRLSDWPQGLNWIGRHPQIANEIQKVILEARESKSERHLKRPSRIVHNPDFEINMQTLRETRDLAAQRHQLPPSLIASKQILAEIARKPKEAPERLIKSYRLAPWQYDLLAPAIEKIIRIGG